MPADSLELHAEGIAGPRNAASQATLWQYAQFLRPFASVIRARHGLAPEAQVDFESVTSHDYVAYAVVSSVLGRKLDFESTRALIQQNGHIIERGSGFSVKVDSVTRRRLKEGQLLKEATRLQYWRKLVAALKRHGADAMPPAKVRSQITDLIIALRIEQAPILSPSSASPDPLNAVTTDTATDSAGAKASCLGQPGCEGGSSHGASHQRAESGEPRSHQEVESVNAASSGLSNSSPSVQHNASPLVALSIEGSLEGRPDARAKYTKCICPACDQKTLSYNELLYHWCKSCNKDGICSTHVFCGFCSHFYPLSAGSTKLLHHIRRCADAWADMEGWVTALGSDLEYRARPSKSASRSRKSQRRLEQQEEEYLATQGDRPCKFAICDFFAEIALQAGSVSDTSSDLSRSATWHFCPDCLAHAPNFRKAFAVHRSPNVLAQHYQDHLLRRTTVAGESRRLPSDPLYDPPWRCTYPRCNEFEAADAVSRINHLSVEHGVPLLVDSDGIPQPKAQLQEGDILQQWTPDCLQQSETSAGLLFLTRGAAIMKGRRKEGDFHDAIESQPSPQEMPHMAEVVGA
ncbi:unnamed protein product [Parajaminaea phylloscopi]